MDESREDASAPPGLSAMSVTCTINDGTVTDVDVLTHLHSRRMLQL